MVVHNERMVSVRGGMFSVQVAEGGAGYPLVYLHGANGYAGWPGFLDRLAQDYRVYAPAHPGVGQSTGLNHLDDLWDLVQFFEEFLDAIGVAQCHLVGHSYGGFCAAELAAHRPERISRLALVNSLGLWLAEHPVADFFILTPEERRELLWHDAESPAAYAYVAQPTEPEARLEHTLDRLQTLQSVAKFIWPIPERGLAKRAHRLRCRRWWFGGSRIGRYRRSTGRRFGICCPTLRWPSSRSAGIFRSWSGRRRFWTACWGFCTTSRIAQGRHLFEWVVPG